MRKIVFSILFATSLIALPVYAADISGVKFEDLNGNGVKDVGEPGIAGWKIRLKDLGTNTVIDSVFTDGSGNYTFSNVAVGDYRVSEKQETGWVQTAPGGNGKYTMSVASTTDIFLDRDFGNFKHAQIHGMKFNDLNNNGEKEQDEPGLKNWTINLEGPLGQTATTTDNDGLYRFVDLGPGTYTVSEVVKNNWAQTKPTTTSYILTPQSGEIIENVDFGNTRAQIFGMKFEDLNGNGTKDVGEPGIEGWKILLKNLTTNDVVSTFTNASGTYAFLDLKPDDYRVSEKQETGWVQTAPGGNGKYTITLIAGQMAEDIDFGNFKLAEIRGIKYEDIDGDGQKDTNEPVLKNWKIYLDKPDGTTDDILTDSNGEYVFLDLGPGDYIVREHIKNGWGQSQPGPLYGFQYEITPESGNVFIQTNFGNYRHVTIKGRKYHDENLNGVRDNGEGWLKGWTIKLINLQTGEQLKDITNNSGRYTFTQLAPGNYIVQELLQGGWIPTNPKSSIHHVAVISGQVRGGVHFGNATIQDHILGVLSGGLSDPNQEPVVLQENANSPRVLGRVVSQNSDESRNIITSENFSLLAPVPVVDKNIQAIVVENIFTSSPIAKPLVVSNVELAPLTQPPEPPQTALLSAEPINNTRTPRRLTR